MKLPRGEDATIDARKLVDYALDPDHGRGGPKAYLFRSLLGLEKQHAPVLTISLRHAAAHGDAVLLGVDQYGATYRIDFDFTHDERTVRLRSGWKISKAGAAPYLTTVFVLKSPNA